MVGSDVGFLHEVLLYRGADDLTQGVMRFVDEGHRDNERVVISVGPDTTDVLHSALGADQDGVVFVEAGSNPARRMSMWQHWLEAEANGYRGIRGVGEPIWPGRHASDMVESQHHESLLNLAFSDAKNWRLMCLYDSNGLPTGLLKQAMSRHPFVIDGGLRTSNADYAPDYERTLRDPLPDPPATFIDRLVFDLGALVRLRAIVAGAAARMRVSQRRMLEFVTAVNEIATNSIRHGGGHGVLCLWRDERELVAEISDAGKVGSPLVGRLRFADEDRQPGGLWFAHQVCDLVQLRSAADTGTVVRLHLRPG